MEWVDKGAPQGNPADGPKPLEFKPADEWVMGEPDLVIQMEKGFTIWPRVRTSFRARSSIRRSQKTAT